MQLTVETSGLYKTNYTASRKKEDAWLITLVVGTRKGLVRREELELRGHEIMDYSISVHSRKCERARPLQSSPYIYITAQIIDSIGPSHIFF